MNPITDPRFWMLLLLGLWFAAPGRAAEDAAGDTRHWLQRMIQAMNGLAYEGTFVYLHGGRLESLRIEHTPGRAEARERLLNLNGRPREIRRGRRGVTCITPGAGGVSVEKWVTPGLGGFLRLDFERLGRNYLLHPLGDDRIAGREAVGIGIIPRDRLRYGYRLFLDRASGLPLEIDLMDPRAQPIERVMFTSLELGEDGAEAHPSGEEIPAAQVEHKAILMPRGKRRWTFDRLPPGFEVRMHDEWTDDAGGLLEHFLVSDGLASVSVYVEPLHAGEEALQGAAHLGAVHAWGRRLDGFQITAVGETPAAAARLIAEALRPLEER